MRKLTASVAAFALYANAALAANIPYINAPLDTVQATVNSAITSINSGITPASMATTPFRNYIDNGEFAIYQRGTAATAGGTTSGCNSTATGGYSADRWCVDTNVGSGAGYSQVITSSPPPVVGSAQSLKVYRNSGALTQPVCAIQEIPTSEAIDLQGQPAVLSFYAQALAGLAADNGNVISANIITGTGSDEGLGTVTASPAITPAFTGLATLATANYTLSASAWNRYTLTASVPTSVKEIAVEICFTPTATGAGATDGFALSQVQLEQGTAPSAYEFRPYGVELAKYQRYFYSITEPATGIPVANGVLTSTTSCALSLPLPQPMRAAPVTAGVTFAGTALSTSTFRIQDSTTSTLASTFLVFGNGATTTQLGLTATLTTASTAGWGCQLQGAGGGAIINVSTDF